MASLQLQPMLNRLEALSLRERVMLLAGIPLVIGLVAESLVFSPARQKTALSAASIQRQTAELKSLNDLLAQVPASGTLPAADQLQQQRDELQRQIASSKNLLDGVQETVDWGTVVRGTVAGARGLTLTSLRAAPPEVVFAVGRAAPEPAPAATRRHPSQALSAASAAAAMLAPRTVAKDIDAGPVVYRHRAELTVQGDFQAVLTYLDTLQRVPGALHWEKLQLTTTTYPAAQLQLTLFTLSDKPETPFN